MTRIAPPATSTRPDASSTVMVRSPPRLEHCLAVKQALPNLLAHHGPATAYAEPAGAAFKINLFLDANGGCQELASEAMQNGLSTVALASPVRESMHASSCFIRRIMATLRWTHTSHRILINACMWRKESQQQLWLSCLACIKTCQGVELFGIALPCSNCTIVLPREGCTSEHVSIPGWPWVHWHAPNPASQTCAGDVDADAVAAGETLPAALWVADMP